MFHAFRPRFFEIFGKFGVFCIFDKKFGLGFVNLFSNANALHSEAL